MLRRNSGRWSLVLLAGLALIFVPIASAANAERATQTLTLLALVSALATVGVAWLALRQTGYVRSAYLGAAALTGSLVTVTLFDFVPDFAGLPREPLAARFFISALFNALGIWVFVIALRRIFPRRNRGMACAAIVLALMGLFPGPFLLRQGSVAAMNITEIDVQLRAGFLYWTAGAMIMVAPFLALLTVPGDWFERAWSWTSSRAMAIPNRWYAIGLMLFTFAVSLFFAVYSFDRRPTTADEIAQLWHARMLLDGRLAMPPDPNPEFFSIDNVIDRPVWMSQFPIGGPAVMAIGLLFGVAWLLNPVLTALLAYNVYRFAQRAYGEAQARAAAAVVAVSPMLLLMGGTYMNHTPTAWLVTSALAALPLWISSGRGENRTRMRTAAIIGFAIGCATTIRPLDGVLAGLVIGLVMLAVAARDFTGDRTRVRSILVAIASGAVPLGLLLVANWRTTGHPLHFGYEVLWGPNHSLGLHDDPTGNPHTAWRALLLAVKYSVQMNWITTSWPVPVLLIVVIGLMLSLRPRMWDVALLGIFASQLLLYAFYWHDGQFIGPRFMFTAVPALLILAARAPFIVSARVTGVWRRIAIAVIPVCIAVAWLRSMAPFGVRGLATEFKESRTRLKVDPPPPVENALVFVQEGASSRLVHRLWGLGVSRRDAARVMKTADACSLLEAIIAEERRPMADSAGRMARIEGATKPFTPTPRTIPFPDRNFRVSDPATASEACAQEVEHDNRVKNTVAYGAMLMLNRFDDSGRIGGPAVFVMDLRDRNDVLRARFGDRVWYRYEIPRDRPDSNPVLVRYDRTPAAR
jgi:hypothetical protein